MKFQMAIAFVLTTINVLNFNKLGFRKIAITHSMAHSTQKLHNQHEYIFIPRKTRLDML
jgi:hypothetical protein